MQHSMAAPSALTAVTVLCCLTLTEAVKLTVLSLQRYTEYVMTCCCVFFSMISAVIVLYYLIQRKMQMSQKEDVWGEFNKQLDADEAAALTSTTAALVTTMAESAEAVLQNVSNCTDAVVSDCINATSAGATRLLRAATTWAEG
mmetsp:Transcript_78994/g.144002  ORF Transcript_78994/g.144002 Transcript_78994/m.144002 type:complete len:144 (-) Transcript_78994:138-569(-)